MAPRLDPTDCDPDLPRRADVVVIGGGIAGVGTALSLAEKGISVTLVEKGRIAGEQSSRNWGWCRTMGRDLAEVPLSIESVRLWERMAERVGADVGFRRAGVVYLCETAREMAGHEAWLERAREFQVDSRVVGPDEVDRLVPGSSRRWAGALFTPSDGRAEPQRAVPLMAAAARRLGASVLDRCAARGVELRAGRVAGVVTERGTVDCEAVVLAGGAWSRLFLGNLGVDFPQLKVLGSVLRTEKLDGLPEHAVGGADFAFRKRQDGGYTVARRNANEAEIVPDSFRQFRRFAPALVRQWHELRLRVGRRFVEEWRIPRRWALDRPSPFEAVRVLDPLPSRRTLDEGCANLVRAFPGFAAMRVAERWGGLVDVTPDGVPVISPVAALPGFFLASGFSGHGFGLGPGAGRLMADLVAGDLPIVDPAPFRFERFARPLRAAA